MKRARFPAWAFDAKDWFRFEVVYNSKKSRARVGRIHTPHGHIDTPGFVPVGKCFTGAFLWGFKGFWLGF